MSTKTPSYLNVQLNSEAPIFDKLVRLKRFKNIPSLLKAKEVPNESSNIKV